VLAFHPYNSLCSLSAPLSIVMASYIRSPTRAPGHAAPLRDADKPGDYFADHDCPGYALRATSGETLRRFSPGAVQFLCEATTPLFPNQGTSVPSAKPLRTASYAWCSAVTSLAC
jgi:hypothetical protein